MNRSKVVSINRDEIIFDNGVKLYSDHQQDCYESHYLNISDLSMADFEGLEFDLTSDNFFRRIDGYGIELIPIHGFSVKIAGHGNNNGYYSHNLSLVLSDGKGFNREFDITECQNY